MRLLCIILSIYVLMLSIVPCCFDDDCGGESESAQANSNSRDHEEDDCGACSQFMTCGTCPGFVSRTPDSLRVYFSAQTFALLSTFLPGHDYVARIWQPPQFRLMHDLS